MEAQHKYENVMLTDDADDQRSSTEVDESLMGDEKQWHTGDRDLRTRRSQRSKWLSVLKSSRWAIDTLLLLVILGLLVRDQLRQPEVNKWQFGGDLTGVGPRCKYWRHVPPFPARGFEW